MLTGLDDTLNQNDCVYSIVFNLIQTLWPHLIECVRVRESDREKKRCLNRSERKNFDILRSIGNIYAPLNRLRFAITFGVIMECCTSKI